MEQLNLHVWNMSDTVRRMDTYTKETNGIRTTTSRAMLPRSISEVTVRDIAWIIGGMLLAYLVTSI